MGSIGTWVNLDSPQTLAREFSISTILNLIPRAGKVGKWVLFALFLLNIRSWPLVWHFRIFRPAIRLQSYRRWLYFLGLFRSKAASMKMEDDWMDSITPVGANPFTMFVPYRTWASFDDSDLNGHLSNSSYAKILDGARFKTAMEMFPMFFRSGGWMALAATNYHFIKEIPMLSSYEIRTSIAAWDQKWLYVISKFVRKPNGKKKFKSKKSIEETKSTTPTNGGVLPTQSVPLRTPGSEDISSNGTPFIHDITATTAQDTEKALEAVAAGLTASTSAVEPDGAILHTIVVSRVCYKIGRITVPPAVVLGVNGFSGTSGHSLASPHEGWLEAKKIMSEPYGGSTKQLKAFLTGGWKDVPEGERWWEQALGEEVEKQRVRNLGLIEGLRSSMQNARTL
ncbi:hypothetical protein CPB84DRAFT_1963827 [Gymnopilus junonius]|uniref:Thioesterase/thiol ester dehydrase-isomerase n=1 Tax=Gymnopilus junonius TaxID=109634 RepID=A0A9P5TK45_GYMJU|nr:hypothetical protein CPB84DRAFT_1963827 [Gymnopilus junonius]